jgi:tetratricopeptide (TPR) repeat protein
MQKVINLIEAKKYHEASEYLRLNKNQIVKRDYLFFSGLLKQLFGETQLAQNNYEEVLKEYPFDLASIINLAAIFNERGEYLKSLEILSSIDLSTQSSQYQIALFDSFFGLRNNEQAEAILQKLILIMGDVVELLERQAALLLQQNNLEKSISLFLKLADVYGDSRPQIYGNLAAAYNKIGEYERGLFYAEAAIKGRPKSWQFHLNKANSLMSMERTVEAENVLQILLAGGFRAPEILGNLARIENLHGNIDRSITFCTEALEKSPEDATTLCCLADNLAVLGKTNQAYNAYRKSLSIKPIEDLTNWHFALTLLRDGKYKEGWEQYKWGFKRKRSGRGTYKFDPNTEWNGSHIDEPLLVWGEQGIGDELMFSKFLKYIPSNIKNIELRIDKRLVPVFEKRLISREGLNIRPYSDEQQRNHIPIGNLPSVLWSEYEADTSSLKPFLSRTVQKLSSPKRIGIAWRGGKSERMQSKRSVPIGLFRRLKNLIFSNSQIILLQYNPLIEETEFLKTIFKNRVSLPNYDAYKDLDAWIDHIDSCDLLISVDNSAVHFAGAMGIPTLALIPQFPDFRWGRSTETNVWYESVRLLRNSDKLQLDDLALQVDSWLAGYI